METKSIKTLFISVWLFLLFGCEVSQPTYYGESSEPIVFELDVRLPKIDGYYHLTLDNESWQTTHRISGHVYRGDNPVDVVQFEWASTHHWYLGDTLGYVVQRGLTDGLVYVSYDTSYITGFNGTEVPTINCCSYSNVDGEVNTMVAPVRSMRGDTLLVGYLYFNDVEMITEYFGIILD